MCGTFLYKIFPCIAVSLSYNSCGLYLPMRSFSSGRLALLLILPLCGGLLVSSFAQPSAPKPNEPMPIAAQTTECGFWSAIGSTWIPRPCPTATPDPGCGVDGGSGGDDFGGGLGFGAPSKSVATVPCLTATPFPTAQPTPVATPAPTAAPEPTPTPEPDPTIDVEVQRASIVSGGVRLGRFYSTVESNPHQTYITATIKKERKFLQVQLCVSPCRTSNKLRSPPASPPETMKPYSRPLM